MLKSSTGYEFDSDDKPFGLYRILEHDQPSSYPGERFKSLLKYVQLQICFLVYEPIEQ